MGSECAKWLFLYYCDTQGFQSKQGLNVKKKKEEERKEKKKENHYAQMTEVFPALTRSNTDCFFGCS